MEFIRKGDRFVAQDSAEPLIATRDEYNSRVWAVSARDFEAQSQPGGRRVKEEPYLILPDRTLMRHYEHGFSDEKYEDE